MQLSNFLIQKWKKKELFFFPRGEEMDPSEAEHRHVGSTNFNLLSSRSHTIFTLAKVLIEYSYPVSNTICFFSFFFLFFIIIFFTIESSPCGDNCEGGANLIDLVGSESSKAETTGVRRNEGSYINESLLTLGTERLEATNALKKQMWAEVQLDKRLHVIYSDEDRKFDKDITVGLICKAATEFAIFLIQTLLINDSKVISKLHNFVDALAKGDNVGHLHKLLGIESSSQISPGETCLAQLTI
ncbi:hypothetical protein LOK49_LG01G02684 [Camellia lanceoleosa]|uniref:Uncharacterized protein n=1 Tax=Camellia lanceoleosa TaxID=1840588 RepID=A0ACC0J5S7_9ERIC|nr:hypothetical protein LOK49_LG01G02684 [Camellia lanceoleosa]